MCIENTLSRWLGDSGLDPLFCESNLLFRETDDIVMLAFDQTYLEQAINLILSVRKYHPAGLSFVCVCAPLQKDCVSLLLDLPIGVQVKCVDVPQGKIGRWSYCTFLRLFAPWIVSDQIQRIVYMDPDIICKGEFGSLFSLKVETIAMAAEISGNVSATRQKYFFREHPAAHYCNAGVCIMNLDYFRANYSFENLVSLFLRDIEKYIYLDQDFLNFRFADSIVHINPYKFNFQAHELLDSKFYHDALKYCSLIHFSAGKPWEHTCRRKLQKLYLLHSEYPPIIRRVRTAMRKRLLLMPYKASARFVMWLRESLQN